MINLKEKLQAYFMDKDAVADAELSLTHKRMKSMFDIIVSSMFTGGILALTLLALKLVWQMRYPACVDFLIK